MALFCLRLVITVIIASVAYLIIFKTYKLMTRVEKTFDDSVQPEAPKVTGAVGQTGVPKKAKRTWTKRKST